GREGDGAMQRDHHIEDWLVVGNGESRASGIPPEYVPEARQLPPADPATTDAVVIQLNADAEVLSDIHVPVDTSTDDRAAARKFDDEAASHASRFSLEVLRAIDLFGLRPEIKTVVERAFPEKCAAAVVPDIEAALQLSIENASLIYVTYDGEQVVNGRLIMTG